VGFVLAVFVAKVGFEDAGFGASAQDLHGEEEEKSEQVVRLVEKKDESGESQEAEEINRVANAGIEAMGDELAGLRG